MTSSGLVAMGEVCLPVDYVLFHFKYLATHFDDALLGGFEARVGINVLYVPPLCGHGGVRDGVCVATVRHVCLDGDQALYRPNGDIAVCLEELERHVFGFGEVPCDSRTIGWLE
jgi:hypothetical protein